MEHATSTVTPADDSPALDARPVGGARPGYAAAWRGAWPLLPLAQFVAFAGLFAAAVLSLGHLLDIPVPCGGGRGCGAVAAHPASKLAGVPIAYFGLGGYLLILGLLAWAPASRRARLALVGVCGLGAILSGLLLWVSVVVIGSTCPWCVGSGVAMGVLVVLSLAIAWAGAGTGADAARSSDVPDPSTRAPGRVGRFHAGWFWSLAIATAIGVGLQAGFMQRDANRPPIPAARLAGLSAAELVDPGKSLGPGDAPVTVIVFADFFCPACRGALDALVRYQKSNPAGVRLAYRHMPLWEQSAAAAALSEVAAETGRFWDFAEHVHERSGRLGRDGYLRLMSELGVDPDEAERRIAEPADPALARLNDDIALADRLGVSATPTFVLLLAGEQPVSANQRTLPRYLNSAAVQLELARRKAQALSRE